MIKTHSHFCSDCAKPYQCRLSEPCALDNAELCLAHYLERDAQPGPWPLKLKEGQPAFRVEDGMQPGKP
jgi:hypothetical protein